MSSPSLPHNKGKVPHSVSKDNVFEELKPRSQGRQYGNGNLPCLTLVISPQG